MSRSKLQAIADGMRQTIQDRPKAWTPYRLAGGLQMILAHDGLSWRLILRRENVFPSNNEIEICAAVFGAPEGTTPVQRKYSEMSGGMTTRWHAVELNWREIPVPSRG